MPSPLAISDRIGSLPVHFLIDTGSSLTLINDYLFRQLPPYMTRFRRRQISTLVLRLPNNSPLHIQWTLSLPITLKQTTCWHTVYVVRDLWRPCIIGNNFIRQHNLQIDGGKQTIIFPNTNRRYSSTQPQSYYFTKHKPFHSPHPSLSSTATPNLFSLSANSKSPMLDPTSTYLSDTATNTTTDPQLPDLSPAMLPDNQHNQLSELISTFSQVFTCTPDRTTKLKHHIELIPGIKPRNAASYRYAPARRKMIDSHLDEMLAQRVIVPSKSPWASPIVLTLKKDSSSRLCIIYRKLNEVTVRDAYPISCIDDTLDALQNAHFISTLDLRSGYWQVEVDDASKPLTAFVRGLVECTVMPFGLANAPATFQCLMDIVLAGLKWQCCLVGLDDIIVYSPTFQQHRDDLNKVFLALADANLTLKASKCRSCRPEIMFLGHLITSDGIKPDPGLTSTILAFQKPTTVKHVQAFLGITVDLLKTMSKLPNHC